MFFLIWLSTASLGVRKAATKKKKDHELNNSADTVYPFDKEKLRKREKERKWLKYSWKNHRHSGLASIDVRFLLFVRHSPAACGRFRRQMTVPSHFAFSPDSLSLLLPLSLWRQYVFSIIFFISFHFIWKRHFMFSERAHFPEVVFLLTFAQSERCRKKPLDVWKHGR